MMNRRQFLKAGMIFAGGIWIPRCAYASFFTKAAAVGFKTRVYSGVTANLSLVNGTAFATNVSGSIPWAQFLNRKATWSDGSNTAVAFVKAVGTTETYDAEKIVNGSMEADSNWTNVGAPGTNERSSEQAHGGTYSRKIISDDLAKGVRSDTFGITAGELFLVSAWVYGSLNLNSYQGAMSSGPYFSAWSAAEWAQKSVYKTAINTSPAEGVWVRGICNGYLDDASVKKTLTPSATGCTFVNSRGGSTQNFLSVGINGNAASFTLTISA